MRLLNALFDLIYRLVRKREGENPAAMPLEPYDPNKDIHQLMLRHMIAETDRLLSAAGQADCEPSKPCPKCSPVVKCADHLGS